MDKPQLPSLLLKSNQNDFAAHNNPLLGGYQNQAMSGRNQLTTQTSGVGHFGGNQFYQGTSSRTEYAYSPSRSN
jgi:hypothetical protein